MGELLGKTSNISMTFNVLIKEVDGLFVAHCLELDIVATGENADQAQRELIALIFAQIEYAFLNDNLENLFHPAPPETWAEFFACKEQLEKKYLMESRFKGSKSKAKILPPCLISKTCHVGLCSA